ncbi:hypothetical protein KIW84_071028 [Lathyrus oleraceus]|uniref:DUF7745 domain-containing protein n=1 Tax=Pisum sativum TaxID=3888 RepID=A0A9D4ZSN7_PEA|nr:hypothetical protein KIW84_071028 [Pisum sativum]
MAAVPELKRKTCTYSFHREPLTSLIELSNFVIGGNQKVLVDQYGDLLTLLKMVVDSVPLQTLLQFYDPELRCFTFQDYQLAPTLEEVVARAFHLSVKEVSDNWKSSGDVVGLPLKYLVRMAKEEAKKGNWEAFNRSDRKWKRAKRKSKRARVGEGKSLKLKDCRIYSAVYGIEIGGPEVLRRQKMRVILHSVRVSAGTAFCLALTG